MSAIIELWRYRRLVRQLAARDLKARYKVSVLGFFWSLLRPLLTIVVLSAIFSGILHLESKSYNAQFFVILLATYMPWFYFSSALLEGTQSLISNAHLVQKVYCPRAVFPASVVLSNLINFFFSLLVVFPILYLLTPIHPTWALLQLPFVILIHTLFLFGLCLAASVLNVLFRDTTQIVEFAAFVWFYLSPVLYDVYEVYDKVQSAYWLYFLNPMAGILEWYRYSLLASHIDTSAELAPLRSVIFRGAIPYACVVSVAIFVLGFVLHKRLESRAVDAM